MANNSAASHTHSLYYLFVNKRFLPLFVTQFLGAFNDNIFKNALVILITYKLVISASYHGINAQTWVTLAAGLFILPFFLFSGLAGQLADYYEKTRLIRYIKLAEIALMFLACVGFYFQNVLFLLLTLFLIGTQATFFGPLKYAILPEQLKPEELLAGNGYIEAGTFLAILFGTILGGILILYPQGELLISSILMVVAIGGWVVSYFIPTTNTICDKNKMNCNFLKETYSIIKYACQQKKLFLYILGISWFWAVGAIFLAEFAPLAKDIFHSDHTVVTYFLMLFSIGIGIGSLLCNKLSRGKINSTIVFVGALGMTLLTFDFFNTMHHAHFTASNLLSFWQFILVHNGGLHYDGIHLSLDILLVSVFGGLFTVPLYALLQLESDTSFRARVIAANNIINAFFMVLASIFTLLFVGFGYSIPQLFLVLSIGNLLVTIYVCKLLPQSWTKLIKLKSNRTE